MEKQSGFSTSLDRYFGLKKSGTNVRTEMIAGITTFVTMAYIFAVNPSILAAAGMDKGAVFTATAIASIVATLIMGLYANLPFGLSSGMGLNAFFAYTVVIAMGHTWQFALTAVLIEGLIFVLLSIFKIREKIVNGMPNVIKNAVSAGIGIFVAFIGLQNAHVIKPNKTTFVQLAPLTTPSVLICIIGIVVMLTLYLLRVKGAVLIGILAATIVGFFVGVTPLPTGIVSLPPSIQPTLFAFTNFSAHEIFSLDMFGIVFTLLFMDLFDTIGTLIGTATTANMLDKDGNLPRAGRALLSDAIGTTVGALLGTSTVTTFVESSAGISDGGRTGLTSVSTAMCMILALFFAPIFLIIPGSATASALIFVGLLMTTVITKIDFKDMTEGLPAFLTIIMMPFTGSIGDGLMIGIIFYVLCKLIGRKFKEISGFMYVLVVIFLLKYLAPWLGHILGLLQ